MEATRRARLEPRTSRSRVRGVNRSATHAALRVISIRFLLVICTINALYKNRVVMRIIRTWSHKTTYLQMIFYQLLLTTSRGTQRICSSKQIFPSNLPKCLNWLQKSLFILFCCFKVLFFQNLPLYFCRKCVTNYVWYDQFFVALILHSRESLFLQIFIF